LPLRPGWSTCRVWSRCPCRLVSFVASPWPSNASAPLPPLPPTSPPSCARAPSGSHVSSPRPPPTPPCAPPSPLFGPQRPAPPSGPPGPPAAPAAPHPVAPRPPSSPTVATFCAALAAAWRDRFANRIKEPLWRLAADAIPGGRFRTWTCPCAVVESRGRRHTSPWPALSAPSWPRPTCPGARPWPRLVPRSGFCGPRLPRPTLAQHAIGPVWPSRPSPPFRAEASAPMRILA
jgi:hypothetical protein